MLVRVINIDKTTAFCWKEVIAWILSRSSRQTGVIKDDICLIMPPWTKNKKYNRSYCQVTSERYGSRDYERFVVTMHESPRVKKVRGINTCRTVLHAYRWTYLVRGSHAERKMYIEKILCWEVVFWEMFDWLIFEFSILVCMLSFSLL